MLSKLYDNNSVMWFWVKNYDFQRYKNYALSKYPKNFGDISKMHKLA